MKPSATANSQHTRLSHAFMVEPSCLISDCEPLGVWSQHNSSNPIPLLRYAALRPFMWPYNCDPCAMQAFSANKKDCSAVTLAGDGKEIRQSLCLHQ